ncbi:MAG TPA: hypothetical protein DIT67_05750 [Octadecabacter sp.]|nr:hypothetical protein [Octadecabacter sp.]
MAEIRNLTCKTNPVQRRTGGNAVAAAAYRAGENLRDEAANRTHRFAGRSADIETSCILSCEDAPDWHFDRAALWNNIEANETRKDSRTGRDVVLGLAWELTPEQRKAAVLEFAQKEFLDRGYVVDIAFHKYGSAVRERDRIFDSKSGEYITGEQKLIGWKDAGFPFLEAHQVQAVDMPHVKIERSNGGDVTGYKLFHPHAHVLVSPRAWDSENGAWAAKVDPLFNKPQTAKDWRYDWPKIQNRMLEDAGWDFRISCTASSGDEALPLKSEDLPAQAYHIERRNEPTTAQLEADFNRIQNEAVRTGQDEREQTETGEANQTERGEAASVGGWWRNMRVHFSDMRGEWHSHFRSAWDTVKERWRGHHALEPEKTPEQERER